MQGQELPVVRITGNPVSTYTQGTMQVLDDGREGEVMEIKLKVRGSSSTRYNKKSLAIKVVNGAGEKRNVSLLGMRRDNKWILDAMAVDKARMRNRVAFDVWNEFSLPSYVTDEFDKNARNGIDGRFVELWLNDQYHGLYCLNEDMDRKQLGLVQHGDTVHGLLFKAVSWKGTVFDIDFNQWDNNSAVLAGWECKYPDLEDDGPTDWMPLVDNIHFVITADHDAFCREAERRFDLPVLMDYIIFMQFIEAQDNAGKNTYAYFYDIARSTRQGLAPWDMDATFGRGYDGSELDVAMDMPCNLLCQRLKDELPGFMQRLRHRYAQWRCTAFGAAALHQRFAHCFSLLRNSGALQRETERWNGANGIVLDFDAEEKFIDNWIDGRLAVVDSLYDYDGHIALPSSYKVYDMAGRRVTASPRPKRGIYIVGGRKRVF